VELHVQDDGVSYGADDLDDFIIAQGSPVTSAAHVAFDAPGRDAVDAFFEAAIANGATVRGEPGVWTQYSDRYYAAFVNDLHGNNVEAVWHAPEAVADAPLRSGVP
jgi:lactoylglutathione lyase